MVLAIPFLAIVTLVWAVAFLNGYRISFQPLLLWAADVFERIHVGTWRAQVKPFITIANALRDFAAKIEASLVWFVQESERPFVWLLHELTSLVRGSGDEIAALAEATEAALARLRRVGIPNAVANGLRLVAGPLAAVIAAVKLVQSVAIPALRGAVADLDVRIGRTAKQARAHARRLARLEALFGAAAFTGLVAVALNRLGLKWLRCPALNRIGRMHGCTPWRLLEMLLAPTVAILALRDMCSLVKIIQRGAIVAEPVLESFIVTGEGFLCGGNEHLASGIVAADRAGSRGFASAVVASDLGR